MTAEESAVFAEEKTKAAEDLARKHFQIEVGLTQIFRLTQPFDVEVRPSEPIKLLEVNRNTFASGIRPLQFGPAPASGIPFPSVIIEVTPDEFAKIQTDELKLPRGWKLGEEFRKPQDDAGAA